MTPEQKAAELINKMYYTQSSPTSWMQAKECALVAVDEIIKYSPNKPVYEIDPIGYFQKVKQEIEKL